MKITSPANCIKLFFFIFLVSASCSKDSDLLAEFVLSDGQGSSEHVFLVFDDMYSTTPDTSIVLDVLSNDTFDEGVEVRIVNTSEPVNGTVKILENNTIVYTPGNINAIEAVNEVDVELATEETSTAVVDENNVENGVASAPNTEEAVIETEETIVLDDEDTEVVVEDNLVELEETSSSDVEATEFVLEDINSLEEITSENDSEDITSFELDATNSEIEESLGSSEETTDEFTYTVEVVNEDETVSTQEGNVIVNIADYGELKAFPTAQGFGKYATGGRGGYVVEVTNLNDSGAGSLRAALLMTGRRTIVFRVGGTINCNSFLDIRNGSGNVTIAGQTAPGDGILLRGAELRISASNVIMRYLKIRAGSGTSGSNEDGINISAYNGTNLQNIIIDHCSVSWARDENFAVVGGFAGSTIKNVTLQNSIISESRYGALNNKGTSNITYFKNLFALNSERNIRSNNPISGTLDFEMINNLVYGAGWRTNPSLGTKFTVLNNKYKTSNQVTSYGLVSVNGESDGTGAVSGTYAYISGNIQIPGHSEFSANLGSYIKSSPFSDSGTVAHAIPAAQIEGDLLGEVGASFPNRDAVDIRLINNIEIGNGNLATNGSYPPIQIASTTESDSDKDGMTDTWELNNGLNPNDSSDGNQDRNDDGYTNLEDFLNQVDF